jgi:hypothetical protein
VPKRFFFKICLSIYFLLYSEDDQICKCNLPIKLHVRENMKLAKSGTENRDRKNTISIRDAAHGRLINGAWVKTNY